jgi:hypothetical protein
VDEWYGDDLRRVPVGWSHPVVVRDLLAPRRHRQVRERWRTLRGQVRSVLHTVDCRDQRNRRRLTAWLLAGEDRTVLALSSPPRRPESHIALQAGFDVGVPAILWPRSRCGDDHVHSATCGGDRFLDVLRRTLESTPPHELPQRVRQLRVSAHAEDSELALCKAVTLFWHDPETEPGDPVPLNLAE